MHPIFVRLGVFHLFFEKQGEKCTQILYFWVLFKKKIFKNKNFLTNRPHNSEIPLEGNTTIFFFGLIGVSELRVLRSQVFTSIHMMDAKCHTMDLYNQHTIS